MKKFLRYTLLGAIALCSVNQMSAREAGDPDPDGCYARHYIKQFSIEPGQEKEVEIFFFSTDVMRDGQFQFVLPKGLRVKSEYDAEWDETTEYFEWYTGTRVTGLDGTKYARGRIYDHSMSLAHHPNEATGQDSIRFIYISMNATTIPAGDGAIGKMTLVADDDYNGAPIEWVVGWSSASWTQDAYGLHNCAYERTEVLIPSALGDAEDGEKIAINDLFKVVDRKGGYAFLSNGVEKNEWIKVLEDEKHVFTVDKVLESGSLIGTYTVENGNPTLVMDNDMQATSLWVDADADVNAAPGNYDITQTFAPIVNQLIKVKGYYTLQGGTTPTLRAYNLGNGTYRGQSVTIDNEWVEGTTPEEGQWVEVYGLAQLKEQWSDKQNIASTDDNAFQNYVVRAISIDTNITTGVDGIDAAAVKSVKYVNMAGQQSSTPFEGVNIVVTTMNDGTTTATKMVK